MTAKLFSQIQSKKDLTPAQRKASLIKRLASTATSLSREAHKANAILDKTFEAFNDPKRVYRASEVKNLIRNFSKMDKILTGKIDKTFSVMKNTVKANGKSASVGSTLDSFYVAKAKIASLKAVAMASIAEEDDFSDDEFIEDGIEETPEADSGIDDGVEDVPETVEEGYVDTGSDDEIVPDQIEDVPETYGEGDDEFEFEEDDIDASISNEIFEEDLPAIEDDPAPMVASARNAKIASASRVSASNSVDVLKSYIEQTMFT